MISRSNISVVETLRKFANAKSGKGIDVCFLVPTETGLKKSIMDATQDVRLYLKNKNLHDFDAQEKGETGKAFLNAHVYSRGEIYQTRCSVYRPKTKNGDPRIWFYNLSKYADPTDLLALIKSASGGIVVVNCSKTDFVQLIDSNNHEFWQHIDHDENELNPRADELLSKLKFISSRGDVETKKAGDTGVGYTLETLCGISANNSKSPDYKGIELKATRVRSNSLNKDRGGTKKFQLFGEKPSWEKSRLKSSKMLLDERGYLNPDSKRKRLNQTIGCGKVNRQNLVLSREGEYLYQNYVQAGGVEHDVLWAISTLERRLMEKHNETFWVYANAIGAGDTEKFHYNRAEYTSGPDPAKFILLLEAGAITVDYSISETVNGGARDHGYNFRIKNRDLDLIFGPRMQFDLH